MKIQFTPTGGSAATLWDDSVKYTGIFEQLGASSVFQREALYGAPNPADFPRGNIGGELIFTSSKSYTDNKTTFTQFKTEYGRLNQKGSVVLTEGDVTVTFANATCKGVQRIFDAQHTGTHMGIRYTFAITTIA